MKTFLINMFLLISINTLFAQAKELDFFIRKAQDNSPLINQALNNNKIIDLDVQLIKSILTKPQVNVDANILFSPIISHDNGTQFQWISPGANSYQGYDLAFTDGGRYQAAVSISQPLLKASTLKTYAKHAEISNKINNNKIQLSKHELTQLVSRQYILCIKAKKQSEISNQLIHQLKNQLQIMHQLVDNAIYKQTDLLILEIELKNYKLEYENYKKEYRNNCMDLNLLCGIEDTTRFDLVDKDFKMTLDNNASSMFIIKYHLDSMRIVSNQLLREEKYKPQINLFADAGINAIYRPTINRFGFSTGITFSWKLYDGHKKEIQRSKSQIEIQNISFKQAFFEKKYRLNKLKYKKEISLLNNQIQLVKSQLQDYKKLMDLFSLELSQAQVSIMDYKNIIRDISGKKQTLVLLQMKKQLFINNYNYWNY